MSEIYLLLACTSYEGSSPMLAFSNEADALACKALCDEHAKAFPKTPDAILETPENDKEWNDWCAVQEAWQNQHPVDPGWAGGYDHYAVTTLELQNHG